ncbi:TonB-dependent receptor plug domain-containing protein [Reichenbachiella versicolor]|uniref:TonB-dependent receptor plug domain-containing protein n=1 Tax=Reichenbachiella versicolor TaxID=1821036 RepID=UPI000D6E326F|nr:TonB-dependent receptor plug domain-containing protein [Reichenbachiella versicolor]
MNFQQKIFYSLIFIVLVFSFNEVSAQQKDVNKLTRKDILAMDYDHLLEMPFEDVLKLAEKMGVSMDELYELLLNKDVTAASKKAESSFEAPLSTTVLTGEQILASGARNIEEAFRLVPGMIVREKTTGNFDIHIRGNDNIPSNNLFVYSENSMTLVMIDGRQVYNYVNGGTFWETLPVDIIDIDRIEIVRGAASALYGANAATGVINIITKRPENSKLEVNGNVQGGSLNTKIANLSTGQAINDKLSYRVSGNYQYMDRTTDKLLALDPLDSLFRNSTVPGLYDAYSGILNPEELYKVEDLFSLPDPSLPWLKYVNPKDGDGSAKYQRPEMARDRYGVNGFLFYDYSDDINTRVSLGSQYSEVISSTYGDQVTPLSTRYSQTSYIDLYTKIYGLSLQANYNFGWQDIVVGDDGFKLDLDVFNAQAEYDFEFGGLNLRPGIYYQQASQNDKPHLDEIGNGYLNAKRTINAVSGSFRADYSINDFRFIGALRAEKYNVNDDVYLPFQFTASYNLDNAHFFRANYARANRSPFAVDSYSNYDWDRTARSFPNSIKFVGSENLDLAVLDNFEIGYRMKPTKNIQIDIEAFYSIARDFGYLSPDSVVGNFAAVQSTQFNFTDPNSGSVVKIERPVPAAGIPEFVQMAYQNIEVESHQLGVTANVSWVANENLVITAYGTYQQTTLKNYYPLTTNEIIGQMTQDAGARLQTNGDNALGVTETSFFEGAGYDAYPSVLAYSANRPDVTKDEVDHEATPSFYGGASLDWKGLQDKLGVFVSTYFFTEQVMRTQYGTDRTSPKGIVNTKVSYKIYKDNAVFVNARNVLDNSSKELGWMDETSGVYMAGLQFNF